MWQNKNKKTFNFHAFGSRRIEYILSLFSIHFYTCSIFAYIYIFESTGDGCWGWLKKYRGLYPKSSVYTKNCTNGDSTSETLFVHFLHLLTNFNKKRPFCCISKSTSALLLPKFNANRLVTCKTPKTCMYASLP